MTTPFSMDLPNSLARVLAAAGISGHMVLVREGSRGADDEKQFTEAAIRRADERDAALDTIVSACFPGGDVTADDVDWEGEIIAPLMDAGLHIEAFAQRIAYELKRIGITAPIRVVASEPGSDGYPVLVDDKHRAEIRGVDCIDPYLCERLFAAIEAIKPAKSDRARAAKVAAFWRAVEAAVKIAEDEA